LTGSCREPILGRGLSLMLLGVWPSSLNACARGVNGLRSHLGRPSTLGVFMTFYRGDVQYAIPTDLADEGFYWATQCWYFVAGDAGELAWGQEGAIRLTAEVLNVNCLLWYQLWREWPSGVVVSATNLAWDHPVLSGPYGPLWNTVYVALLNGDKQVGYKRVRSPLRLAEPGYLPESDFVDGLLRDEIYDYYQDTLQGLISDYGCFTNGTGVPVTGVRVRREVSGWQLRHGTKRRSKRRIWLTAPYVR